ncbi:MAG: DUF2971 domain-containing protein [Christensenellales bacterium]|jgi:hypothetical protein
MMDYYNDMTSAAQRHSMFRHYTTFEALASILQDMTLRMSALRLMNDPIEEKRTDKLFKNKYFVIGFSHEQMESIPMWRMYGRERQGVCLEFTDLNFVTDRARITFEKDEDSNGWELRLIKPIDVIYVKDLPGFTYPYNPLVMKNPDKRSLCSGYAKSELWKYENETRIIAYIDVKDGTPCRTWRRDGINNINGDDTYAYPLSQYVYLPLTNETLAHMKIRFNPFMTMEHKNMMRGGIMSICPSLPQENIVDSSLQGNIILR